jgi:pimeloyl-ACP methyl ester carboxylesterase
MTSLPQAKLAELARSRGERREMVIDGQKTVYWFYKSSTKKSLGSVIFIHGYRGNHHGLEAIAGAITTLDVYIPDLPGFGQSEPFAQNHSIVHYATWVGKFIAGLKLKSKPHLLGHSFGSIVVSCFASQSDAIASLILENPVSAPALKGPKAATTLLVKGFFALAAALPESAGDRVLKSWPMVRGMSILMTKSRVRELRKWIHGQHDENFNDFASRRVALEGYAASISNCVGDYANSFAVPVLALVATQDDITSIKQQREMFALIESRAELKIFENVGHLTHYEIPDQIAAAIEHWVSGDA